MSIIFVKLINHKLVIVSTMFQEYRIKSFNFLNICPFLSLIKSLTFLNKFFLLKYFFFQIAFIPKMLFFLSQRASSSPLFFILPLLSFFFLFPLPSPSQSSFPQYKNSGKRNLPVARKNFLFTWLRIYSSPAHFLK